MPGLFRRSKPDTPEPFVTFGTSENRVLSLETPLTLGDLVTLLNVTARDIAEEERVILDLYTSRTITLHDYELRLVNLEARQTLITNLFVAMGSLIGPQGETS